MIRLTEKFSLKFEGRGGGGGGHEEELPVFQVPEPVLDHCVYRLMACHTALIAAEMLQAPVNCCLLCH